MNDNEKRPPEEILEEVSETREFMRVFGMSPEEILKKAEEACGKDSPLTGEQALIFTELICNWIRIANNRSDHCLKLEFFLEVLRDHDNFTGMKSMIREHEAFVTDLIETMEFFRGVAILGLVAPKDDKWFEEAYYFFSDNEDEKGYFEGLRFPSRVIRNWALATFPENDPIEKKKQG